jgi:hypothetical protein
MMRHLRRPARRHVRPNVPQLNHIKSQGCFFVPPFRGGRAKERKPKHTDSVRSVEFLGRAKEVCAFDDREDFDRPFMRAAATKEDRAPGQRRRSQSRRTRDEEDFQ